MTSDPDLLLSAWLSRSARRRVARIGGVERVSRSAALGGAGEALVAGFFSDGGWPVLRNVFLPGRKGVTEIDLLVRLPAAILVIEVKTWSGSIGGCADDFEWSRTGSGGEALVINAVRQNLYHVEAVLSVIGDRAVNVRGLVVNAGRARFEARLARDVVALADLQAAISVFVRPVTGELAERHDRAWELLRRHEERRTSGHG